MKRVRLQSLESYRGVSVSEELTGPNRGGYRVHSGGGKKSFRTVEEGRSWIDRLHDREVVWPHEEESRGIEV